MGHEPAQLGVRDGYKSWFDVTVLIAAHILLLPLWLLLWIVIPILIRLGDGGPVFYTQDRVGKCGRTFTVFKFRTMILDAEAKGAAWTTDHDPRVTRVGRVLRRTALDELPEVINIWKGDMSLVGPRALNVAEQRSLEVLIAGFEERLKVRPGLTGLAQVYDSRDDAREKYRYDLEYLQRMSPWMDMKLLILSVRNTLGIKWDRRSGKSSDATWISGAPTGDNRQPEHQGKVTSKRRTGSEPPRQDS